MNLTYGDSGTRISDLWPEIACAEGHLIADVLDEAGDDAAELMRLYSLASRAIEQLQASRDLIAATIRQRMAGDR